MIHNKITHARDGISVFFKVIAATIGGIVLVGVFELLFGWLVQLLWNWLMPVLFGLKMISFWQAFGIVILCRILFHGLGSNRDRHHDKRHSRPFHGKGEWPDEEWKPDGAYRNWRIYHHYWDEEGKEAFEQYLERKGLNKNSEKTEQPRERHENDYD